jgi:ABC-2 type transport system permease protein
MQKYLYSFKMYLLTSFQYRFDTALGLIMSNISMFITIAFWILIYRSNGTGVINGYTIADMITFFVISSLFRTFILSSSGFEISSMIKSGDLSKVIIKPYSISIFLYWKYLSMAALEFLKQFSFLLLIASFFAQYLTWDLSVHSVIILVIYLVMATVISHLIWFLLGMMAFWFEQAQAVMWSFAVILNFLSGMFMPLDFFPRWSVKVLELMPFAAFSYIPAKIYMNQLPVAEGAYLLIVYIMWVFVLIALNLMVWRAGTEKYSAVGG